MNRDLTIGNPRSVLLKFCLPLIGSVIFQQLYNIADSLVAGKFISEEALAAVGNSYEITLIFLAVGFGCNIGCSVVVSQLFGAKRMGDVRSAVYTSFISCIVLCAVLVTAGLLFCRPILGLINTPKNILNDSALYLNIYLYGLPFVFFYNISNGIFSALGDSKTPFIFLAASSTSNIAMDILFVNKSTLNMGVAGVAWATFICQGISCILSVIFVLKRLSATVKGGKTVFFSFPLFRKISSIAVPSILQQSFVSFGNIIIQSVINSYGSGVIAGYAASIKLNNFVLSCYTTVGSGVSNYSAQNYGAKKFNRIRSGHKSALLLLTVFTAPIVLLYFFAGKYGAYIFMDEPTADALHTAVMFLRVISPFYFAVATKLICDGVLRGLGKMRPFVISTFTDLILRVILSIVFSKAFGSVGIWLAWPAGWIIGCILSLFFYKKTTLRLENPDFTNNKELES